MYHYLFDGFDQVRHSHVEQIVEVALVDKTLGAAQYLVFNDEKP